MNTTERKYYIDWIRVIAIGLLLIYHIAIGFQKWGIMIGFIVSEKTWDSLWVPMSMLNTWRIPLLFFVSGMGVYFAMHRRTWKQLLVERATRIGIPLVFGALVIVPIHLWIWAKHYNFGWFYTPNRAHLWFLGNILVYVVVLLPFMYWLKKNEHGKVGNALSRFFSTPLGLLPVVGLFVAEALILQPMPFEMYALTWHGVILGLIAFAAGFCFVLAGNKFWHMIVKWRWLFLVIAVGLFVIRVTMFGTSAPYYLLVTESQCWIYAVLAFACKYLNRPGKALNYLSQAAYPVYILHMIFLYLGSYLLFRTDLPVYVQFTLLLLFTLAGCFAVFEILIRRVPFVGILFGVKPRNAKKQPDASVSYQ